MSRVSPLLVALLLSSAPATAQVQGGTTPGVPIRPPQRPIPPRDQSATPATGTAKIRGLIVAADDSRPLRRVVVRVMAPELREPRSVSTDLSGRYEIADLPAGRYTVTATRAGFVTISHGQTRPNEMGRPIEVSDGQTVERINFSLPRGAAITGRILDEYGEPVAGASVQAMQMRYVNGVLQPATVFSGNGPMLQTPDTGEFRVWGLAPGEYLIQANVSGMGGPFEPQDRAGYSPTYYPNTTIASEAQTVRVEVGQTASGIEIMLTATRTARISGTTLDGNGQPLRSGFASAMLQSSQPVLVMRNLSAQIKPDGTFSISGVTPGTYTVRASLPPSGPGTVPETLTATVTVAGDDVSGVVLTPLQPATISGRVHFEPPTQMPEASELRLMIAPKDPGMRMGIPIPGPPVVSSDYTFEAKAAPGETVLRVFSNSPGTQWAMKSITLDGRDIANDGITLSSGAAVKGIDVVLTNRLQTISGAVTNERGEIVTGATVFVFPQNPDRWFPGPMALASSATTRPDQNGRYSIKTLLPPGDYYAVAVEYLDPNRRSGDRTYLEELSRQAIRFSIREEESKALDLKISTPR
jgi:hypothetical protein